MRSALQSFQPGFLAAAGVLGVGTLVLQLYVMIGSAPANGITTTMAVVRYFDYFTILTNILVAIACLAPVLARKSRWGRFFLRADVTAAITTYIIFVGIAYNLLLKNLWNPVGLQFVADRLLHDIMPIVYTALWLLFVPKGHLRWGQTGWWLIYLVVYFLYAMAIGAMSGFYPYPFVDVNTLGYGGAFMNGLGLLFAFAFLALVVTVIDWILGRGQNPRISRETRSTR